MLGARLHDRARDIAREAFLAERLDDEREIALRGGIHQIGRARAVTAHAHVERAVIAEREAALGLIELHRRDAEIEQDAVDRLVSEAVRDVLEIGEAIFDERQPSFGLLHQREAARDSVAVAVDADDRACRSTCRIARVCPPAPNVPSI